MIEWLIKPVIGGVIGYSTNWLAIKMLFKPYTEKRIGGIKVPFTPGLIPRERDRIAKSLGTAVGGNLLRPEVIEKELLNETVIGHIKTYVVKDLLDKPIVIDHLLEKILGSEKDQLVGQVVDQISDTLYDYLKAPELGQWLEQAVREQLLAKLPAEQKLEVWLQPQLIQKVDDKLVHHMPALVDYLSAMVDQPSVHEKIAQVASQVIEEKVGALGAMFINPKDLATTIVAYIQRTLEEEPTQEAIRQQVQQSLIKGGRQSLGDFLTEEERIGASGHIAGLVKEEVLNKVSLDSLKRLLQPIVQTLLMKEIHLSQDYKEKIEAQVEVIYTEFVKQNVGTFLETFNVSTVVEGEINQFSVAQVEQLIFGIVDKELKAITWLGGLLGAVIGVIYIFI